MQRLGVTIVALTFLSVAAVPNAFASVDSEDPPKPPAAGLERRWYGLPIIATDVASDALLFVVPPLGLAGMTLTAPLIHLGHDRGGAALASLGLRLTAEAISFLLLIQNSIDCEESCSAHSAMVALLPVMLAQVLDASIFAWTPAQRQTADTADGSRLSVVPALTVSRLGGAIGFGGTF